MKGLPVMTSGGFIKAAIFNLCIDHDQWKPMNIILRWILESLLGSKYSASKSMPCRYKDLHVLRVHSIGPIYGMSTLHELCGYNGSEKSHSIDHYRSKTLDDLHMGTRPDELSDYR